MAQETEGLALDRHCLETGVKELLRDPAKGVYYLAEVDGEVVGQVMITYEWSDWRNGNLWWFQSVYVRQDFRQQGIFSALFNHVEKLARSLPEVCGLRLYMHEDNARARRSYQRLGMMPTRYIVFDKALRDGTGEQAESGTHAHGHD